MNELLSKNECLARMAERSRQAKGEKNGSSKLTEEQVLEIRRLKSEGITFGQLAEQFNAGNRTIQDVVYRESWKHI